MKNEFELSSVEKYTKAIVRIDYKKESYKVTIEEQWNYNNVIDVIDCITNDSIEDSELEQELIDFAYETILNNK
jgi:hypothetical protein